jgi:hypothetical protein
MSDRGPWLAVASLVGLAAYCLSHVLGARLLGPRRPYLPLLGGIVVGLATTLAVSIGSLIRSQAGPADTGALSAMNALAYLALAFGYFNFVNLTIASLRIRMLEELADAGGQMPRAALLASYNSDRVIALRIARLIGAGHLVERQGRFYVRKKLFLALARVFDLLRWFIMGPSRSRAADTRAGRLPGGAK